MTEEIKAGQIIEYDKDNTPHFIIDGVDVSGCKHYWNTHNLELCKINFDNNYYSNGLPLAEKCNDHKDCYYRQLKRLETENEKLKEDVKEAQETYNFNRILYKTDKIKLRKALEEIKDHTLDECKRCGKNITSYCELCWVNNILSLCNEVLKDEYTSL